MQRRAGVNIPLGWMVVVLGVAAYGAWHLLHREDVAQEQASAAGMRVTVVSPKQQVIAQRLRVSGTVVPREDVVVMSELSQVRIVNVLADEGMQVQAGQVLAQLDGESLKHAVNEAQANFQKAELEFKRAELIKNSGALTKEALDQRRASYLALRAQRDNAVLNLKRTEIKAPSSGLLYERQAKIGDVIVGSTPLFRIAKDNENELEADVVEAELVSFQVGQAVEVSIAGRDKALQGVVRLVSPHVDAVTRTAKVRVSLPKDAAVAVGAYGHAEVVVAQQEGLAVPPSAVMQDTSAFVWVVDAQNIVHRVTVTVGLSAENAVAIAGQGITPQTRIVAKAGAFMNEGDVVSVVTE